jgi:adenosylcobinamide kinase/adenosylcobinamide-phosphate guanylyltransferase
MFRTRRRAGTRPRRRGRLILILGGASSGKSTTALRMGGRVGRRAFVATAEALDHEMVTRIRRHQADRGPDWETAEVPVEVTEWLRAKGRSYRSIVLDCLTLWLSNLHQRGWTDEAIANHVAALIAAARASDARVVMVSNELGMGIVPMDPGTRHFRDLMGQANQQVAAAADEVYLLTAGIARRLK